MKQCGSIAEGIKHAAAAGLSFILSVAMGVTAVAPVNAADSAVTASAKPKIASVASEVSYDARNRVPVVESMAGRGAIPTDSAGEVAASGLEGYDSVLARVSVFDAGQDATVYAAGSPALNVAKGHDASQSVLIPVKDGKIPLHASSAVNARVEVLSAFKDDSTTPGATNVSPAPVVRADSEKRLGIEDPQKPSVFGVTGLGGVPAKNVRAVWVTAHVVASQAGTFAIEGQRIGAPWGESSISTIVIPDDDGNVEFQGFSGLQSVSVTVRGWVTGTEQNKEFANVPGSYVPVPDAAWHEVKNKEVHVSSIAGAKLGLALVAASPSGERSFVDVGRKISGRSSGTLVDAELGATPQMEIVENGGSEVPVGVRGKTADVKVLLLGDVLSDRAGAVGKTTVTVDSPKQGADVDFKKGGWLLEGKVSSNAAIRSVEIYGNGKKIATASVQYTDKGGKWSFWGGWPESGRLRYDVKAVSADGSTDTESKTVYVSLPDPNASILSPDVVKINEQDDSVASVNDDSVVFNAKPTFSVGKIISSGVTKAAPYGFLRWVDAIEHVGDEWRVKTHQAALADAILQGKTSSNQSTADNQKNARAIRMRAENSAAKLSRYDNVDVANASLVKTVDKAAQDLDWVEKDSRDFAFSFPIAINCGISVDENESNSCDTKKPEEDSENKEGPEGSVDFPLIATGTINVGIVFGIQINFIPNVNSTNSVNYFKIETHLDGAVSLSAGVKAGLEWEKLLYTFGDTPITVPAPLPIPVVIVPETKVYYTGSIELSGTSTMTWSWLPKAQVGILHNADQKDLPFWQPYAHASGGADNNNNNKDCVLPDNAEASIGLEGSMGIKIDPSFRLWKVAGPELHLWPQASISAEGKAESDKITFEPSLSLKITAWISFLLELKIIKWDFRFDDFKTPELKYEFNLPLKSWEWPLCKTDSDKPDPDKPGSGSDQKPPLTWTPPSNSGDPEIPTGSVADAHKPGDTIELTQKYLEDLFGVPAGTFKDLVGVNTQADGKGQSYAIGGKFVVPAKAVTLYLQFKQKEPDNKKAKITIVVNGKAYVIELPVGSKFTLTEENLEKLLGLDKGTLKDLFGLNTRADGSGTMFNLNDVITIPEGGLQLFVRYSPASDFTNIKQVVGDYALDSDGYVWMMGRQADFGYPASSVIALFMQNIDKLYAANTAMFAVDKNGELWAWGSNQYGDIPNVEIDNDQALPDYSSPTRITGLPRVKDMVFDRSHQYTTAFLLGEDGAVWVWGDNSGGQFGDGTQDDSQKPRQISGLPRVKQILCEGDLTAALGADGSVWVWGTSQGNLGNGNQHSYSLKPVLVEGIPKMRSLALDTDAGVYAVSESGDLWHWGSGIFGYPDTIDFTPRRIGWGKDFTDVFSGGFMQIYALTASGDLYGKGNNSDGSLGFPPQENDVYGWQSQLKKIGNLAHVKQYESSFEGGMALSSDGFVSIWNSSNSDGIIGDGSTNPSLVPKRNLVLRDIKDVGYGYAIKQDGSLWLWSDARTYYENRGAYSIDDVHKTSNTPSRYGVLSGSCYSGNTAGDPNNFILGFRAYVCPVSISKN